MKPLLDVTSEFRISYTTLYSRAETQKHQAHRVYTMECIKLVFIVHKPCVYSIYESTTVLSITLLPQRAINTRGTHNNQCGNIHRQNINMNQSKHK